MVLRLHEENTYSMTGGHRAVAAVFIVRSDGRVERVLGGERTRGTYSRGEARVVEVPEKVDGYVVHVWLVRNTRGWVKGRVTVYTPRGEELYSAVIRERKLRGSRGSVEYAWVAVKVLESLGLLKGLRRVNVAIRGGPRRSAAGGNRSGS